VLTYILACQINGLDGLNQNGLIDWNLQPDLSFLTRVDLSGPTCFATPNRCHHPLPSHMLNHQKLLLPPLTCPLITQLNTPMIPLPSNKLFEGFNRSKISWNHSQGSCCRRQFSFPWWASTCAKEERVAPSLPLHRRWLSLS